MSQQDARRAVDAAFREEWGRVVATLIGRTGDWDLAEECAQEAFTEALRRWPQSGVPQRPGAWLTTVAGNRAIDRLRRRTRGQQLLEQEAASAQMSDDPLDELLEQDPEIEDDRLRLIFTCCHPALPLEGRVALTLRTLVGLSTAEIAKAFLVPVATMGKRITRAKQKIVAAGIPYRVPPAQLLPERTGGVLAVLYLLFNEGYASSSGEGMIRGDLCEEAIRLTRALRQLMPDEPEVMGLLALMLIHHSRRAARVTVDGELITLEHQDRERWDLDAIREGRMLLVAAGRRNDVGIYQLQAAVAAEHTEPVTDWNRIAALYALLEQLMPSAVVTLNRAVAVAISGRFEEGLALLDRLTAEGQLADYYLLDATRADLLRRHGDRTGAAAAYGRALLLAPTETERRFLATRLAELNRPASQAP